MATRADSDLERNMGLLGLGTVSRDGQLRWTAVALFFKQLSIYTICSFSGSLRLAGASGVCRIQSSSSWRSTLRGALLRAAAAPAYVFVDQTQHQAGNGNANVK